MRGASARFVPEKMLPQWHNWRFQPIVLRMPTLPPRSNDGTDTNRREPDMALTRDYKETVLARIKRDPKFARLFYAGTIEMLLEGETAETLSRLRDLVHAEITFKELARQTGLGEKTFHRM